MPSPYKNLCSSDLKLLGLSVGEGGRTHLLLENKGNYPIEAAGIDQPTADTKECVTQLVLTYR